MTNADSGEQRGPLGGLEVDIARVLELELSTQEQRDEHGPFVLQTLQSLNDQVHRVIEDSNDFPENAISASVWAEGVACGEFGAALTQHFRESGWLVHEQNASSMWVHSILAVCAHYPHMVGPAMLANADCHDRQGDHEQATKMYISVVKDFACHAEDWLDGSENPQEDDRITLESLATAIERLLARGVDEADDMDIAMLLEDTKSVLAGQQ